MQDDLPANLRRIPEAEARSKAHDVPDVPSAESAKRFEAQLNDEREHGHPAFDAPDE